MKRITLLLLAAAALLAGACTQKRNNKTQSLQDTVKAYLQDNLINPDGMEVLVFEQVGAVSRGIQLTWLAVNWREEARRYHDQLTNDQYWYNECSTLPLTVHTRSQAKKAMETSRLLYEDALARYGAVSREYESLLDKPNELNRIVANEYLTVFRSKDLGGRTADRRMWALFSSDGTLLAVRHASGNQWINPYGAGLPRQPDR